MNTEKIVVEIPSKVLRVERAACPHGHSLMDPAVPINGFPSIKVIIQYGAMRGAIHLDPVYGSFHNLYDVDIPEGVVVEMFCPTCAAPLRTAEEKCDYCFSPVFNLFLPNGGLLQGCLKNGCHQHKLKLVDLDAQLGSLHGDDHLQLLM